MSTPPAPAVAAFERAFGAPPSHEARAPGRVNLVGDHIDYHDLAVLPMALRRHVSIAFRPRRDGVVRLVNADERFSPVEIRVDPSPPPGPGGDWGNYVRAAVAALAGLPSSAGLGGAQATSGLGGAQATSGLGGPPAPSGLGGLDGCVWSDLPGAAGLSSSSALVVATASALDATRVDRDWVAPGPEALADLLARAEHYVGTRGGGMDQAASIGGEAGSVLRVEFAPVSWTARRLPDDWAVIVAHSGVRAEKSGAAQEAYNALRTSGGRALKALASHLGVSADFASLRAAAPVAELLGAAQGLIESADVPVLEHVLREADRVDRAWVALGDADLPVFGSAMTESHVSLSELCGVGHARLDELVATAVAAGALGARLTGAGFGGCMVALAEAARAASIVEALTRCNAKAGLDPESGPVFRAYAGEGARVAAIGAVR